MCPWLHTFGVEAAVEVVTIQVSAEQVAVVHIRLLTLVSVLEMCYK
jgi:hypothetical protein